MKQFTLRYFLILLMLGVYITNTTANSAAYEQRRQNYIDSALVNFQDDAIVMQAYRGLPVTQWALDSFISRIPTKGTADFDIVRLIRVLYLTNGQYDTQILNALQPLPFWLTKNEDLYGYWSENHMIMWMSSNWLLHEKYGWAIDNTLDQRLRHYLRLKVQFGFYEFYSSVYAPYCLSGLLNLADFAQDPEMKNLATQAAAILLKDLLTITNSNGVFYPVAGRNYYSKYATPYGQNHNHLIYLLTGLGQVPSGTSHAGSFLATSTINTDSIETAWTPEVNMVHRIGHTIDTSFIINSGLSPLDKVMFQWSFGGYFHPAVALETVNLLYDSAIWNHPDWQQFQPFQSIPIANIPAATQSLSSMSMSTVICGQDVHVFKHNTVTLASVNNFWKGKLGFQQYPVMANVGTTPVYPASGEAMTDWYDRKSNNANEHLPYVGQKNNVALIMFRPEPKPALFGFTNDEVALHFKDADFDEVRNNNLWLLGRQQNGYVAVRRSCIGTMNGERACPTVNGQTWVLIVGDSAMYGSFNDFETKISQAQYQESWYWDSTVTPAQVVYYARIDFDTTSVEYAWGRDSVVTTGITKILSENGLLIYPNPTQGDVTIDVSSFANKNVSIKVVNALGQQLYFEQTNNLQAGIKHLNTTDWAKGFYIVSVEAEGRLYVGKVMRE